MCHFPTRRMKGRPRGGGGNDQPKVGTLKKKKKKRRPPAAQSSSAPGGSFAAEANDPGAGLKEDLLARVDLIQLRHAKARNRRYMELSIQEWQLFGGVSKKREGKPVCCGFSGKPQGKHVS